MACAVLEFPVSSYYHARKREAEPPAREIRDVVLPGMVVPLETSQPEVGAAIDAARMPSRQVPGMRSEAKARVLLVPRLADRGLAGVGTLAVVEQVGRLPGGQPGAVVRGKSGWS